MKDPARLPFGANQGPWKNEMEELQALQEQVDRIDVAAQGTVVVSGGRQAPLLAGPAGPARPGLRPGDPAGWPAPA